MAEEESEVQRRQNIFLEKPVFSFRNIVIGLAILFLIVMLWTWASGGDGIIKGSKLIG